MVFIWHCISIDVGNYIHWLLTTCLLWWLLNLFVLSFLLTQTQIHINTAELIHLKMAFLLWYLCCLTENNKPILYSWMKENALSIEDLLLNSSRDQRREKHLLGKKPLSQGQRPQPINSQSSTNLQEVSDMKSLVQFNLPSIESVPLKQRRKEGQERSNRLSLNRDWIQTNWRLRSDPMLVWPNRPLSELEL